MDSRKDSVLLVHKRYRAFYSGKEKKISGLLVSQQSTRLQFQDRRVMAMETHIQKSIVFISWKDAPDPHDGLETTQEKRTQQTAAGSPTELNSQ